MDNRIKGNRRFRWVGGKCNVRKFYSIWDFVFEYLIEKEKSCEDRKVILI